MRQNSFPPKIISSGARVPRRVHVVSPMNDFSVLNRDDRNELVAVGRTARENCPVHFVFEDQSPGNASRAYGSDTELAPDDRRDLSAEDFYGSQHCFV
jgi:hypothetical protein